MAAKIAGFILRAHHKGATARFYRALGLELHEHRHGDGPLHFEMGPNSGELVSEIYLRSDAFDRDAVMIEVPSIKRALDAIRDDFLFYQRENAVKEVKGLRFVYVLDPDGRHVMICEKKK